ncbi:MAG: hypothetical protein ACXVB9_00940 [Bdellovibrionota bacterium]
MAQAGNVESLEVECPSCGLPARDWPHLKTEGFLSPEGDFYCCKDCFEGHICECGGERREGKVFPDELIRKSGIRPNGPKGEKAE